MLMANDRQLALARAQFESFRDHLPSALDEREVDRFHSILNLLEGATGEDLSHFRIPADRMKPRVISARYATRRTPGYVQYSDNNYCPEEFMRAQIDGIARYLQHCGSQRQPVSVGDGSDYWSMSDDELELQARKYNIPPYSRTGNKLEQWYADRDRIIDTLLKRDRALKAGRPAPEPTSNVINVGSMYGSSIQQGADRSSVVIDYGTKQDELRRVVEQIKDSMDELKLSGASGAPPR